MNKSTKRIAIVGGGPSGLFVFKRLIEANLSNLEVHIFEKQHRLGTGMPYGSLGACEEHLANVSSNEIPEIIRFNAFEWMNKAAPKDLLEQLQVDVQHFSEYKVIPRLLLGEYLSYEFNLLLRESAKAGISAFVHLNTEVTDVKPEMESDGSTRIFHVISSASPETANIPFDQVVICSGHNWPKRLDAKVPGFFYKPYPPQMLKLHFNHPVALKGSSLTAVDAIRTIARSNGSFSADGKSYQLAPESPNLRIVLHSRNGLLPVLRTHLQDAQLKETDLLTRKEMDAHARENDGFISLDYVFEKNFKAPLLDRDPHLYEVIKDLNMETFVAGLLKFRRQFEPFELLKLESAESLESIHKFEAIHWKELLAALSYTMNYPAKFFSAEDSLRFQKILMPVITVVIAWMPQGSCRDLIALYDAGILSIVAVGDDAIFSPLEKGGIRIQFTDSEGENHDKSYETFVDCTGQPHLMLEDVPFPSLRKHGLLSPATLRFRDPANAAAEREKKNRHVPQDKDVLHVSGVRINNFFQSIDAEGNTCEGLFIMAVPYIGGYNPDYSGLDFCETASEQVVECIKRYWENQD